MLIVKAQKELLTLFSLQQMHLNLFLTRETLQFLPLFLYSQRFFKVMGCVSWKAIDPRSHKLSLALDK